MRLRTFDDGGRLFVSDCRRYQRPMSVGFPTNRRDYIIFPGVFTSHGRGGGGRGGKKVVDCRALRGRGALVAPEIGRDGSRPSAFLAYYISTLLHGHFYDGEGAPLLRPHARLTSFGGYVATGVRCPHAAFGRAGARPSRDTWRWRPRHRICLPFSRRRGRTPLATACAAHFVRGICRYGRDAIHRVRACRLRSVATSATLPLPTTNYHLPITLYQLRAQIGGCQFTSE